MCHFGTRGRVRVTFMYFNNLPLGQIDDVEGGRLTNSGKPRILTDTEPKIRTVTIKNPQVWLLSNDHITMHGAWLKLKCTLCTSIFYLHEDYAKVKGLPKPDRMGDGGYRFYEHVLMVNIFLAGNLLWVWYTQRGGFWCWWFDGDAGAGVIKPFPFSFINIDFLARTWKQNISSCLNDHHNHLTCHITYDTWQNDESLLRLHTWHGNAVLLKPNCIFQRNENRCQLKVKIGLNVG